MIKNIPKPEISPDFTVDDIRKIREWHSALLVDATAEERTQYFANASRDFEQAMARRRTSRMHA